MRWTWDTHVLLHGFVGPHGLVTPSPLQPQKNSPVYGNFHGTRMYFSMFFLFCFYFFHFCHAFSMFFTVVLPQVFSHIRPGPSKSPSWPSWVLNESWTSEWGEGEVDDTICDLDLPRPGGGTVPIEWCVCVFTPWFWSFYHVLTSFTVFYFVLPCFTSIWRV